MRNYFYLLLILPFLTACNDGDVLEIDLEFDNTFQTCGEIVFFKIKSDPPESLSIFIDDLTIEEITENVFRTTDSVYKDLVTDTLSIRLDGFTNKINYRSYSAIPANPFCNDVPSSELNITSDAAGTGDMTLTTTFVEDDNDGIPSEFEDLDGDGNLENDDTDGDGVPNYLDDDDDGDNVKTIDEFVNFDTDNDFSNALNTDLAYEMANNLPITPNYLDNDDDGDLVLTRDEESLIPDLNPANDVTDNTPDPITGNTTPDYLNDQVIATATDLVTAYRQHTIRQIFTVRINIINLSIPQLNQDFLNFGMLNDPSITAKTRIVKTIFN